MKLISMTDFVLEQTELLYEKNQSKLIHNIVNYAQFLKQPLNLEMFVSEDKVLFENIKLTSYNPIDKSYQLYDYENDHVFWLENNDTIECKVDYNLSLTENAIKQFL